MNTLELPPLQNTYKFSSLQHYGEIMNKEELADNVMETFIGKLNSMADANKGWNKKIQLCLEDIETAYIIQMGDDGTVAQSDKKPLQEKDESAHASVYTTVDTINGILKKEINPMMAVMQRKVRIEGDMSVITKLSSAFM